MSYATPLKVLAHAGRLADWERGLKPAPVTVEWSLSSVCDIGCGFCHFAHTHAAGPLAHKRTVETGRFADPDVATRAMGQMRDAGVRGITWMGGGEPCLHPAWDGLVGLAQACGFKQGVYTNGRHMKLGRATFVKMTFSWAVVSLDYAGPVSYAAAKGTGKDGWRRACEGVAALRDADGPCKVWASFIVGADNCHEIQAMVGVARALGVKAVLRPMVLFDAADPARREGAVDWVDHCLPDLRAASQEEDVVCDVSRFEAYRDWKGRGYSACLGIRLNATITPDGRVWVCPNRMGFEDSCLGNLTNESFGDIWRRHPGRWTDFSKCRVMCRLHGVNGTLAPLADRVDDQEFV